MINSHWNIVQIGDVCELINGDRGKNYPSQSEFTDKGVPFINAGNLENWKIVRKNLNYISDDHFNRLNSGKVKPNDILFCLRGSLGKFAVNYKLDKAAIASSLVLIRSKGTIVTSYLKHFLTTDQVKMMIQKADNGSSQPNLSAKSVREFKIPLPPLPIQKKIAAILDAADAYRQKTKALIEKYDQLTQSLFLEMFGDPVRNEKGWDVKQLGVITTNHDSQRIPVKKDDRSRMEEIYDYYGATGVIDKVDNYTHDGEFLLVAEDGQALVNRKKPIAFKASGKFWVNNHAHVLGENGVVKLTYLEYFFAFKDIRKYVTGIDQFKLNKSNLERIDVPCPPIQIQNDFSKRIKAVLKQKEICTVALKKAEELFQSLLQQAFKGELIN